MSVLDLLRGARNPADPPHGAEPDDALVVVVRHPWWHRVRAGALGVLTGLVSLLLVVAPTLLGWATEARSSTQASEALGVGAALWLLATGARLTADGVTVAVVPLLLLAACVLLAAAGLARAVPRGAGGPHLAGLVRRAAAHAVLAWTAGYAAVVCSAAALTSLSPVRPVWWTLAVPVLLVPSAAAGLVLSRRARTEPTLLGPAVLRGGRPTPGAGSAVRAAAGPALAGAGLLVLLGSLLVVTAVVVRAGDVAELSRATGATGVGAVLLALAQVALLPNLALWAVSFAAGPGFSVLDGASTTWWGAAGGELPLVPVLAALPGPGDLPAWVAALVLVPVLVGAWVGHRALRRVPRLAPRRARLAAASWAAALTALAVGALDLLAGGPLGTYRLASVGAPAHWLTLALAVELTVGALAAVVVDGWRHRR